MARTRQEKLDELARLHAEHSKRATEAPPAPDREDGGLWNLDYASPPNLEDEFMAQATAIFDE